MSRTDPFRYDGKRALVVGGATGIPHHTPEQMGDVMAFLDGGAASGISGVNLLVDSGHVMASSSGSWEAGKPLIDLIMGRVKWNP